MDVQYAPDRPESGKPGAIIFIFITVLIDALGLGIIIPVIPKLVMELTGLGESDAVRWGGYLGFAYAGTQFFCAPIIGNLSDHFGRRPVLLLSLLAFGLDYAIMGFAPTLIWLFVGRVIAGICGASYSTAAAYIGDITAPEKRAQSFGMVGAAFGVGFVLGPFTGGLLGTLNVRYPFFAAAALALINVAYGYFVVPESLERSKRRPFSWQRASVVGTFRVLARSSLIKGLCISVFFWQLAHMSLQSTWPYYTMYRFHWTPLGVGLSLAFVGITIAIVSGGLTRVIIPRLGERRAAIIGFMFGCAAYTVYSLATTPEILYAGIVVGALAGLVNPAMHAIMSREVPSQMQGELQGGLVSIQGLTSIIGPLTMPLIFSYFSKPTAVIYFPGAAFAVAAILGLFALLNFLVVARRPSRDSTAVESDLAATS